MGGLILFGMTICSATPTPCRGRSSVYNAYVNLRRFSNSAQKTTSRTSASVTATAPSFCYGSFLWLVFVCACQGRGGGALPQRVSPRSCHVDSAALFYSPSCLVRQRLTGRCVSSPPSPATQ